MLQFQIYLVEVSAGTVLTLIIGQYKYLCKRLIGRFFLWDKERLEEVLEEFLLFRKQGDGQRPAS